VPLPKSCLVTRSSFRSSRPRQEFVQVRAFNDTVPGYHPHDNNIISSGSLYSLFFLFLFSFYLFFNVNPRHLLHFTYCPGRLGCRKCKVAKVKCDEQRPSCRRCARLKNECIYDVLQSTKQKFGFRMILPSKPEAGSSPLMLQQLTPCKLKQDEIPYFDAFRTHIAPRLANQADAPADFWTRTVLREASQKQYILDMAIGIGALAQFVAKYPLAGPNVKFRLARDRADQDYYNAIKYYAKALNRTRQDISDSEGTAQKRTILIATILFATFELLQGNTDAYDRLAANGIHMLKDMLQTTVEKPGNSRLAALIDDEGIEEAEYFLTRTAAWMSLFSPLYPRGKNTLLSFSCSVTKSPGPPALGVSTQEYWKTWWRHITPLIVWHLQVNHAINMGIPVHEDQKVQKEREEILVVSRAWIAASVKLLEMQTDPEARRVVRTAVLGSKISYLSAYCALDITGSLWEASTMACLDLINIADEVIKEATAAPFHQKTMGDGLFVGVVQMFRECRHPKIRSEAKKWCKQLVTKESSWDFKAYVLGTAAIVAEEEVGRNAAGLIPLTARYVWTGGFWTDDYTEFHVTLTKKLANEYGIREEKQVVLLTKDFEFV
jgi:hypothetical protein